ncbi:MAG: hypothetical protein KBF88_07710 [Polyangiaceae bacterium]|nr:hypothetical protein [Polyangiaceae bacterium]
MHTGELTNEMLAGFAADSERPCLSLYQPTHRRHPENQQDPLRFRNLLKELEASIRTRYPSANMQLLLEPFEALARDKEFWNHTLDGLAVLGAPGIFHTLKLPRSVPELVVVADHFHTKPLRRYLQSVDRYQVLGLSLDKIRLFEGNRYELDELVLVPGVPRTIAEALGSELTEPHQTVASYGGVGGANNRMHHGHGGKADEADIDAKRFFRAVDRAVSDHYTKPSGLPLILAALPEHHRLFHEVSQNPLLVEDGIRFNPESLLVDELRALAWQAVEPRVQSRVASLRKEFEHARSKSVGSDDLAEVAEASVFGRVETLLIAADRQIAGKVDGATGRVELASLSDPHADDLLDDLSELVAKKGGTVLVIPAARMPSRTGLAAIYRY